MCKCTPEIRTPFCCRDGCLPPASREPTESLFAANAEREFARMAHGDHLAHFKAEQLDAWERRLAQFSNRSDSTGYVGRIGVEVLTELRQTREQADALADALGGVTYSGPICYPEDGGRCHWCEGKEAHGHADHCDWIRGDAALRTYLGARHE